MQDGGEEGTGFGKGDGPDPTVQRSHLAAKACSTGRTVEVAQEGEKRGGTLGMEQQDDHG